MMTDVKYLSAHYRTHSMELKQRAMDLAAKDVNDPVHLGGTNVRGQGLESVTTETDPDHIPEKESMNVLQERGSVIVRGIMRGHTVVKGTMTEQEIVIVRGIVKEKGKIFRSKYKPLVLTTPNHQLIPAQEN